MSYSKSLNAVVQSYDLHSISDGTKYATIQHCSMSVWWTKCQRNDTNGEWCAQFWAGTSFVFFVRASKKAPRKLGF
jgi:hypothetical protein